MFTGIVSDLGRVESADDGRLRIACAYPADSLTVGGSIACDGCCLTVTAIEHFDSTTFFVADVSAETLARTTLGDWRPGRRVNLERPLRLQDELGGHLVTGHVDGVAVVKSCTSDRESRRVRVEAPPEFSRFLAAQGSVALDGVSLTVNAVDGNRFGVMLIAHTLAVTTWSERGVGDRVNLEVDLLARYVARIADVARQV